MKTITLEDLRQHFGEVVERIEEGEEIALTRRGVVFAKIIPSEPPEPAPVEPPRKVDWARWLREHPPVKPKKPLTAEETAEFYQALKRDF